MAYYNVGARYEIIGRITNGTTVTAYVLKDKTNGSIGAMNKGMIEQLALNKQIYNCSAQIYGNIVNMKGIGCKLSQLHRYDENCKIVDDNNTRKRKVEPDLKLIGKVQNGRVISDYIVASLYNPNNVVKVPRDKVIKLAKDGRIINAKSQMNGSEMMLRGTCGVNLVQLQTYTS